MEEWNLAPVAQQWVNVALIWIGFAMVAGLLARCLLPSSDSIGPVATLLVGMVGSVVGLFSLSYFLQGKPINPISPVGLFAASAGALVVLVIYRLGMTGRQTAGQKNAKSDNAAG
ncbi:MAG: hypothetical protein NZ602_15880 [Thermoguttaceae bacterium]|nr:hypothetical protein [Thermoguttaceae bacterium]MDW8036888.1 GlsB/YeaQ/YmgE family stress response membrane protein [Thermoguttaceae bacterium]